MTWKDLGWKWSQSNRDTTTFACRDSRKPRNPLVYLVFLSKFESGTAQAGVWKCISLIDTCQSYWRWIAKLASLSLYLCCLSSPCSCQLETPSAANCTAPRMQLLQSLEHCLSLPTSVSNTNQHGSPLSPPQASDIFCSPAVSPRKSHQTIESDLICCQHWRKHQQNRVSGQASQTDVCF